MRVVIVTSGMRLRDVWATFWATPKRSAVRRGLPWASPDDHTRAAFANLVSDRSAQEWVAAHVHREFPRLACGAVMINAHGELRTIALPNDDQNPKEKWSLSPLLLLNLDREVLAPEEELVGFFSTRAPGKPSSAEEILPAVPACYWVISVDSSGLPREHSAWVFENETPKPIVSGLHEHAVRQTILAGHSAVIASCVQAANRELMEWLRKHPDDLRCVHPGTFELIVAEIFRDQGYEVEVLGSWNQADGGIDIIAIRRDSAVGVFRVGVQCKRYVKANTVRADFVWALEGRLDKFHLHKGVLATTAHFEASVLSDLQPHLWRIEIKDFERINRDLQSWGQYHQASSGLWLPRG